MDINSFISELEKYDSERVIESIFCKGHSRHYANIHHSNCLYIAGYKSAGDKLSKFVMEKRTEYDSLIYPIVFLYRHYIELSLKDIIDRGSNLLDSEGYDFNHKLMDLWHKAEEVSKKIFEEFYPYDPSKCNYAFMLHIVSEFNSVDEFSVEFRYSKRKNGMGTLPSIEHINIEILHRNIGYFSNDISLIRNTIFEANSIS